MIPNEWECLLVLKSAFDKWFRSKMRTYNCVARGSENPFEERWWQEDYAFRSYIPWWETFYFSLLAKLLTHTHTLHCLHFREGECVAWFLSKMLQPSRWVHTARPVNDATIGSTQVAPMCASCVLPRKVAFVVWIFDSALIGSDGWYLRASCMLSACFLLYYYCRSRPN